MHKQVYLAFVRSKKYTSLHIRIDGDEEAWSPFEASSLGIAINARARARRPIDGLAGLLRFKLGPQCRIVLCASG